MSTTNDETIPAMLTAQLAELQQQVALLQQQTAVLQAERATVSPGANDLRDVVQQQAMAQEMGPPTRQASRRGLLQAALGAVAATMGAGAVLQTHAGTALATGAEGATTFLSGTTTPTVTAINTSTGQALSATAASTAANAVAAYGVISTTGPGSLSAGVKGQNNGTGSRGVGVWGAHNGSGYGVYGTAARSGYGGCFLSSTGTALYAKTTSGTYGAFISGGTYGVYGSGSTYGVYGYSQNSVGAYGNSYGSIGVYGNSTNREGVFGRSTNGVGVYGVGSVGGTFSGATNGLVSYGNTNTGVYGYGTYGSGYVGAYGIGTVDSSYGVWGYGSASGSVGVYGTADYIGVHGYSESNVVSYGILGATFGPGWSGFFQQDVNVGQDLYVLGTLHTSAGSVRIDHPLDPANKYLIHSSVDSPDMMNLYNGIATLDAQGVAVVQLAPWFGALNRDFRYQLTPIGVPAPGLYIAATISNNQFTIAGGKPGMEVSWLVTGIRQDAVANANRLPVEVDKAADERGHYLHPGLYGAAPDQIIPRHAPPPVRQPEAPTVPARPPNPPALPPAPATPE